MKPCETSAPQSKFGRNIIIKLIHSFNVFDSMFTVTCVTFVWHLIQLEDHKIRKRASLEILVDKIIEGKRKKGRVIPDRETIIQDEMAKVKKLPFEYIQLDYSKGNITYAFTYKDEFHECQY